MGKITFESTLGGSTDLVGPNTASNVVLTLPSTSGAIIGTGDPGVITSNMISGQIAVAQGGTGTANPALVAGTNVSITGAWPNQTINASSNIGGYPVNLSSPQNLDALMFLNNQWANVPQTEIADGGNF
jgi:hypothetical protein